ncbi:MAG: tyrosine-type recombinase/integrase [Methanospirillaceae archaeon]|nr:tyrosine-type recombinase/integrase [Methanospirillaceae archaeon]
MKPTWRGFYSRKERDTIGRSIKSGEISERDGDLIVSYVYEMTARNQLSEARQLKLVSTILGWRKNHLIEKEYSEITMADLYSGINRLNKAKNQHNRPFAQNTKHDYIIILKPFLVWLIRQKINNHLDEGIIRELKNPHQDHDTTHPDEILDPKEITDMLGACTNSRDRALISVHYEAATRIGETSRLRWRDVIWDRYGAQLKVQDEKTKKERNVRITTAISSQYLATWRDDYPGVPEGNALVFVTDRGHPITYWGILKIFKTVAERAGVEKKVTTHIFRKSRGTHLIEQGLPIQNLAEMMWANQATRQINTYIRMSPVEQDRAMLKHAGVITDEESKARERRITCMVCPNCHTQNPPAAEYCNSCGKVIGTKAKEYKQQVKDLTEQNPDLALEILEIESEKMELKKLELIARIKQKGH